MPSYTPATLRAHLQALVEASPLSLTATREPFSFDRQPNAVLDGTYVLDQALVSERSLTAGVAARIERFTLTVARLTKIDGETALQALLAELTTIDRAVRADGIDSGYHAWPIAGSLTAQRPAGRDFCLGQVAWTCDYDFEEGV